MHYVMEDLKKGRISLDKSTYTQRKVCSLHRVYGPRQANLVLIAYASSEGSGEPAHPRSLARTFAARSYKQWVKRTFRQKARSLAPLNGWACAVKICQDGMLEDTNSLDGAHMTSQFSAKHFLLTNFIPIKMPMKHLNTEMLKNWWPSK